MSTQPYDFEGSLKRGLDNETRLDGYFARWYSVEKVNMDFQLAGIDRIFTRRRPDRTRFTVEYKADDKAGETGNAFIETVSVDKQNKPGWAYTSGAQLLIYFVPPKRKIYIASTLKIKSKVTEWLEKYRSVPIPNEGYNTEGVLVPLAVFEEACDKVLDFED